MPSRRMFLQAGLAASITPWVLPWRPPAPTARVESAMPDVYRTYTVVADVRFAPAELFAREVERLGAVAVRFAGDITGFWFDDLSVRWRDAPVAIAGLTAHGPLFCLERWAWDHGLRVVFRGEHRRVPAGGLEHAFTGPPATIARARAWAEDSGHWSRRVAGLVTACEAGRGAPGQVAMTERLDGGLDELPEPLFSWVIAPVLRT